MQHLVIPVDQLLRKIALHVFKDKSSRTKCSYVSFEKLFVFSLRNYTMKSVMVIFLCGALNLEGSFLHVCSKRSCRSS